MNVVFGIYLPFHVGIDFYGLKVLQFQTEVLTIGLGQIQFNSQVHGCRLIEPRSIPNNKGDYSVG